MARGGKGKQYPQDFKNTAIKLAITGNKQIKEIAEELHIHYKTLSTWVLQYKKEHFVVDKQDEKSGEALIQDELKRLRKENARLKMECDILKKATAYFAKETL